MPFLENYKHVDNNHVDHVDSISRSHSTTSSLSTSLSSSHPNLFLAPLSSSLPVNSSSLNDQLPPRYVSLPTIITQVSRNSSPLNTLGGRHTFSSVYDRSRHALIPQTNRSDSGTAAESEDESGDSDGSDEENDGKRRSAIALLPQSSEDKEFKKKCRNKSTQETTKNKPFTTRSFRESLSARKTPKFGFKKRIGR